MKIAAWMKHPVVTVKRRDSAAHARELMERHRINQLPVLSDQQLVGIVTDRDLRDAFPSVFDSVAAPGRRPKSTSTDPARIHVEDVMTSTVLTLAPGTLLADAARLMRRERIGAVPILEGGRLVGIITRSDLLDAFVELSQGVSMMG